MFKSQATDQPDDRQDNLDAFMPGPGSATGEFGQESRSTSVYTRTMELHPERKALLVLGAMGASILLLRRAGR